MNKANKTYILKAYGNELNYSSVPIHAWDDTDATFMAMNEILNRATPDNYWGTGRIELCSSNGEIIREMDSKNAN
jgi:hypothetical protein